MASELPADGEVARVPSTAGGRSALVPENLASKLSAENPGDAVPGYPEVSQVASTTGTRRSSQVPENLLDMIVAAESTDDRYEMQRSLFCLSAENPVRRLCIRVIRNPWFDRMALVAILTNCVQMAVQDPLLDTTSEEYARSLRSNLYFDTVRIFDLYAH
ncbi:hypothetical protein T492DRAFT_884962 [Pavlovales sp. CCMP2436]|nr:hypothetical protein T492DRAFT_884962 [Pavlovales sp. CCMP2436]